MRSPSSLSDSSSRIKKVTTRLRRKALSRADMEAAFATPMPAVKTSFMYSLALSLVSIIMILLPLLYVGLVWFIGDWAYHAYQHNNGLNPETVLGALIVFMLIKPMFIRERMKHSPILIKPDEEPIFYSYIESLCKSVGAPVPKRIHLSCDMNAGAAFHRGFLSFFNKDMDLLLGLPLIVGLDTRQLTGVLAHEFGHFSQGYAMRSGYIIQRVNYWFARVVYQRDIFDHYLERFASVIGRLHIIAFVLVAVIHLVIWLSRLVLWVFMHIAQVCSSLLSRQMEFNADRHAMNMVGNNEFLKTLKSLPVIEVSYHNSITDLGESWRERKLGDNLPALVYNNMRRIPNDTREEIIKSGMEQNTSLYDSHPSTRDRVRWSMDDIQTGVTSIERRPAADLFQSFDSMCKNVTLNLYTEAFHIDVQGHMLIDTSTLIADMEQEEARQHAYNRYFQAQWAYNPLFPMKQYTVKGEIELDKLVRELSKCLDAFSQQLHDLHQLGDELDQLDERIVNLKQAALLKDAGFGFDASLLNIESDSKAAIDTALDRAHEQHGEKRAALTAFEQTLIKRIAITDKILKHPSAVDYVEDHSEVLLQYKEARSHLMAFSDHIENISQLRYLWLGLQGLLPQLEAQHENPKFIDCILQQLRHMHTCLCKINDAFSDMPYPFQHSEGDISIARYLCEAIPKDNQLEALYDASETCIGNFMVLYLKLMGTIAVTGEAIEEAHGLAQLIDPVSDQDFP